MRGNPRVCRQMVTSALRRRQLAMVELLRHARIVSDPKKIAALNAAVARGRGEKQIYVHLRIDG